MVFGSMPKGENRKGDMKSFIGTYGKFAFAPFVDDYNSGVEDFDSMFKMLHENYFPRVVWAPIYLSSKKCSFFIDNLDFIGFTGSANQLRPLVRHRDRILG